MLGDFFPAYFEWWNIPLLFIAGIVGESFGALVGGGSLITLPALLFVGVPIQSAIAINTAAALGTELGILSETYRKVFQNKKLVLLMAIPVTMGGIRDTFVDPCIYKLYKIRGRGCYIGSTRAYILN